MACPRRVFAERLPLVAAPYARTTARLHQAHRAIGFALGQGHPLNSGVLTYISPAPNWLLLFLILTLLAASLEGARTPAWSKYAAHDQIA